MAGQDIPKGVLLESNGFTNWTATTREELDLLTSRIELINRARAEANMAPVREITKLSEAAELPEYAVTTVAGLLDAGARIWVIDLREQDAMEIAYGKLPGVFKTGDGQLGVAPIVSFTAGANGVGKHPVLEGPAVRAAVDTKLIEARDTLVARLPESPERTTLTTADLFDQAFSTALTNLDVQPELMMAASALHSAVAFAQAGNVSQTFVWVDRVSEALTGVPAVSDVNPDIADSITLVWVLSDDDACTGNVARLASHVEQSSLGGPDVTAVYAVKKGALVKVEAKVDGTPYDEDDYSTATITVTLPDGSTLQDSWRVDGRS